MRTVRIPRKEKTTEAVSDPPTNISIMAKPTSTNTASEAAITVITYMHPVYRIWFLYFDAIISWATAVVAFVAPALLFDTFFPENYTPTGIRDAAHDGLIYQMGALYIPIASAATFLLRATKDVKVWNSVQGSVLAVDVIIVGVMLDILRQQGILGEVGMWSAEYWQSLGLTVWCIVIRGLFVAGVGVKTREVKVKIA